MQPSDGWFTITPRDDRGVEVVGRFDGEDRLVVQTRQYLPDDYLDQVAAVRDAQTSLIGDTQAHRRHVFSIPQVEAQTILESKGATAADTPYEERMDIIWREVAQGDYAKLRTGKT